MYYFCSVGLDTMTRGPLGAVGTLLSWAGEERENKKRDRDARSCLPPSVLDTPLERTKGCPTLLMKGAKSPVVIVNPLIFLAFNCQKITEKMK